MTAADFDALAKKVRQEQHGSWDFDSIEFARRLHAAWLAENEPVATAYIAYPKSGAAILKWTHTGALYEGKIQLFPLPPSDPAMVQDALRYRFLRHARANDKEEIISMSEEDYDKAVDATMLAAAQRKA